MGNGKGRGGQSMPTPLPPPLGAPPPPPLLSQMSTGSNAPAESTLTGAATELLQAGGHNNSVTERSSNSVKLGLMRTPACAALAGAELYQTFLKARGPPPSSRSLRGPSRLPNSTLGALHMSDVFEMRPWEARVAAASPARASEIIARVEARIRQTADALGLGELVAPPLFARVEALLATRRPASRAPLAMAIEPAGTEATPTKG